MMILQIILLSVLLGSIRGRSSSVDAVPSWLRGTSSVQDRGRELQLLIASNWECNYEPGGNAMGNVSCTWTQDTLDIETEEKVKITASLLCVGNPVTTVDFRSAKNCECVADVLPGDSFFVKKCDCFVCSDNRTTDVLTVSCAKEANTTVIGNCVNLDCQQTCNGVCTDACGPEADADPNCAMCPRPSEAPTTAGPTVSPTTTEIPSFSLSTSTPTSLMPTDSPTANNPTIAPSTSAPTTATLPTTSAPTIITEAPTPLFRTSQPTVAGQKALGTFAVDIQGKPGLGQAGALTASLEAYLQQSLKVDFPTLTGISLVKFNDVDDAIEYQAIGTFKADGPIPPMDGLIATQRKHLENVDKFKSFVEAGTVSDTGVTVKDIQAEGPAPRGQRSIR